MDRSLPLGLRSVPKLFTAVADAMVWVLFSRGIGFQLHYLNDFLFLAPSGSHEASHIKELATVVFKEIVRSSSEGPSPQVTFLGYELDTDAFQFRLPQEKLERMRDMIHEWRTRRNCTRGKLESLLGHLSHAAVAVRPGGLLLRQLFVSYRRYNKPRNDDRRDVHNNHQIYDGRRNYKDHQSYRDRHYQPRYPPRLTTNFRKRREENIQDSLGQLDTIKFLVRMGNL